MADYSGFDRYSKPHGYNLSTYNFLGIANALISEIWTLGRLCAQLEERVSDLDGGPARAVILSPGEIARASELLGRDL